jgi:hypothetical protein
MAGKLTKSVNESIESDSNLTKFDFEKYLKHSADIEEGIDFFSKEVDNFSGFKHLYEKSEKLKRGVAFVYS